MSWLYYLLEANLYLILFFAFYYFVLRRETWYQYNRAYLLATSVLAFVIPFVQLGILKPAPVVSIIQPGLTQINFAPVSTAGSIVADASWTKDDYYLAAYLLIACGLLINLAVKIYKLIRLSRLNAYKKAGKWTIIETDENKGAFSFFNYLFVSPEMALSETVIAHELVHIRQKHSWDIVYFEIIKVVNWFNPIAYLLQYSIKELHEFIADSEIAGNDDKVNQYTDFLLGNAYGVHESQLTNNLFNKSLLKKRIMMLHQKKSGNSARLKYLMVLPLSAGLLCASTLAFAKSYGWIDIAPKHSSVDIAPNRRAVSNPMTESNKNLIHYTIDPTRYSFKTLTDMTLKLHQRGYKMEFDEYKDDENNPMLKISLRKVDTKPENKASATFRVNALKKGGYVIAIGAKESNKGPFPFVHSEKITFPKPVQTVKMPPPPPAEVIVSNKNSGMVKTNTGNAHTILYETKTGATSTVPLIVVNGTKYTLPQPLKPGQYLYTHATDSTIQIKPGNAYAIQKWGDEAKNGVLELFGKTSVEVIQGTNDSNHKLPPPPPAPLQQNQQTFNQLPPGIWKTSFNNLAIYFGKNIHYPAKEHDQKVTGNVIIELTINSEHKITNVKVMNDALPAFANEVVRVAKRYTDTINSSPGTYTLGIQFNIVNEKMMKTWLPPELSPAIQNKSNFMGIIEAVTYVNN